MTPTALVTGGAGGIGLAAAKALGADHRIVLAGRSAQSLDAAVAELRGLGIEARSVPADVTDRAAVDALIDDAAGDGDLRAVVHSAGVSPRMGDAAFVARINAVGTVHVTESFLRVAGAGDVLVNVGSIAGHMLPRTLLPMRTFRLALTDPARFTERIVRPSALTPKRSRSELAYLTSKAFVIWYSQRMTAAFGAKGARIVTVSPGAVDTELGRLEAKGGADELVQFAAIPRPATAEEGGEVLSFAARPSLGYLTDADLLVDGGTRAGLTLKKILSMRRG